MRAVNYNWFANKTDAIGVDATVALAQTLGMTIKMAVMFARLYTGK